MPSNDSSPDETCPCGHPVAYHKGAYCLGCIHTCEHQHPEGWSDSAADDMCTVCGHPDGIHSERLCFLCWDPDECSHAFELATEERAVQILEGWARDRAVLEARQAASD